MAYDQYMYPMEQPGYQPPPMPDAFAWLMNNPYIGPGSIPPSDFSIVDQGIPNALGNLGQANQNLAQAGQGMAQRMATMTPEYPMGQGFMPTPEAAPQFDPGMVANPGLSFPPAPPGPMPPQGQPSQIGPGGVYEPGMDQAPPQPPVQMPQMSQGMDTLPSFGMGVDQMQPPQADIPPTPMESWMMDYNQQTDDYIAAQREQAKNAMWIQMGQALLANMGSPELAMAGMGQAAAQYGSTNPAMEQYKQGRESERLDLLYKMEQIRRSQQPREFAPRNVQLKQTPDGRVYEPQPDGTIMFEGKRYSQAEFNQVLEAGGERKWAIGEERKNRQREAAWESEVQGYVESGMDRQSAEMLADSKRPTESPEVPEVGGGAQSIREKAAMYREQLIATGDPQLIAIAEMFTDDAELVREMEKQ